MPTAAGLPRVSAGHHGLKTSRVDRVNRHVGANGGINRRPQFHLIVLAAALHAGAEVHDGLFLFDERQRFGQRTECAQPEIVVEHLELGRFRVSNRFFRRRRSGLVSRRGGSCWRRGLGAIRIRQLIEREGHLAPIRRKVRC